MKSLDFEDHPFTVERWDKPCEFCGSTESYLDEVVIDNDGGRLWICSDTDYCSRRQAEQKQLEKQLGAEMGTGVGAQVGTEVGTQWESSKEGESQEKTSQEATNQEVMG